MLLSNVSELPGVSELSGVSELTRVSELSSVSLRLRARAMSIYQRIPRAGAHGTQAPTTTQTPPKKNTKKNRPTRHSHAVLVLSTRPTRRASI